MNPKGPGSKVFRFDGLINLPDDFTGSEIDALVYLARHLSRKDLPPAKSVEAQPESPKEYRDWQWGRFVEQKEVYLGYAEVLEYMPDGYWKTIHG